MAAGVAVYANPLDLESLSTDAEQAAPLGDSPRSLASIRTSPTPGEDPTTISDRLVLTGMSLEQMFIAVDPDGSGVVDAKELSGFAGLLGVSLDEAQADRLLAAKGNEIVVDSGDTKQFGMKLKKFEDLIVPALLESQDQAYEAETRAAAMSERRQITTKYENIALGCLRADNPVRAATINLVQRSEFDSFILLLIVMNALQMALEDPLRSKETETTVFERRLEQAELVFNVCFSVEMLLKVVALGLYKGEQTYLRSSWNVLDVVCVGTAWLPYVLPEGAGSGAAVRTFRLLRPLRTINRFPGLKRLVTAILLSIPQMQVLVVMFLIYLFTFACVAVQLWPGIMLQRCHVADFDAPVCVPGEEALCYEQAELFADDSSAFCDMTSSGEGLPWEGRSCSAGDTCELHHTNPYHGVLSFDNLIKSFIPVLQMATVCAWQEVMHITQNTSGMFATIYFVFGTVFGGYFLYNLFVAVLKSKLQVVTNVTDQGEIVFNEIDVDGSGEIDLEELTQIFKAKRLFFSDAELVEVFQTVDIDGNGVIDIEEFTSWLRSDDNIAVQLRERMQMGTRDFLQLQSSADNLSTCDLVRANLHQLEPSNDWHALFEYYDIDGDNAISVSEFSTIIRRDLGMHQNQISDEEIAEVFADIDTDNQGDVDAEEFAAWVVEESVEALWVKLQEAVKDLGTDGLEERLKQSIRKRPTMAVSSDPNDDEMQTAPWKQNARSVIDGSRFRLMVVGLVAANTAILAMDRHNIDPELDSTLHLANMALTIIFVLEMAAKVLCYTRREFNTTAGWRIDVVLAVGALADTVAFFGIDPNVIPMVDLNDVFIIARAIRPLRLVYTIPALAPVYTVSIKTLAGLVYILFLIGIFMFIFSILGMQLFGGEYGELGDEKPRAHYDSFALAFTTTFQIMTFDSWQHVMYNGIRAGGGVAALYFVAWIVLGSMVMLNLLLVIIMEVYVSVKESFSDEALQAAMVDMIDVGIDEMLSPLGNKVDTKDPFENASNEFRDAKLTQDRSCGIFPIKSSFRMFCITVTHSKHLDHFILALITANCVTMAMDHPDIDPDSQMRLYLDGIDLIFTIVFTVEMCLHIVAIGFYRGPHTYLKSGWNRIDFAIVVVSWADYLASALEIGFLRTLRLLRALRALRMFNRLRGLKVLIDSLMDSVSALSAIFAVAMIVFLGYAILGVSAFKGLFYRCNDNVGVSGVDTCIGTFTADGMVQDRAWMNAHNNFDNVGSAMFTLFTVSTSNDWIVTAQLAIDAPAQVGQQPVREHSPWRIIYFMVFIVIVNFFFLNLFIGVIYGKYVDRAMEGMTDLSTKQLQWLDILRQLPHARPQTDIALIAHERQQRKFGLAGNLTGLGFGALDKTMNKAGNMAMDAAGGHVGMVDDALSKGLGAAGAAVGAAGAAVGAAGKLVDDAAQAMLDLVPDFGIEGKAFDLVEHKLFDQFIILCIIANCVMMGCTYHNEPAALTEFYDTMNIVFVVIFSAEMMLKLVAFGTAIYFSDRWLRFDCFVVVGSWVDLLFSWVGVDAFSSSLFRIIRISRVIGRIGRVFKVLSDSKSTLGLDEIMQCLYQALPQLAYIGILVGLILFIFAVLGMNLFGKIARNGCIGENSNFERAPQAVLTLLGVATKDRITCTIHGTMVQEPFCSEAEGTCGSPGVPEVFFISFSLVIMFTTLEMFVNVVLQSYEDLSNAQGLPITLAHIEQFENVWKKYDPRATGWLALTDVDKFLSDLPSNLGFDEQAYEQPLDMQHLRLVDLPNGHFSRYLLGENPEQVAEALSEEGVVNRIKSISGFVFQQVDVEMKDGLHAGTITSVVAGENINGKPSFVVQSNCKKSATSPEGKVYTFLAETPEERDHWVATIKGTRGGAHYKRGELHKKAGLKGWKVRTMVARSGSLEWKSGGGLQIISEDAAQSMDVAQSVDESQHQQAGSPRLRRLAKRISISKLQTRLAQISGLTKADVNAILAHACFTSTGSILDHGQIADPDVEADSSKKKITRVKWEEGLLAFNETRRAAADILKSGGGRQAMLKSIDASGIDMGDKGTQAMLKLILGQVNFFEMLYAICERKAGKKLPAENFACREARIKMGVRMPSIKDRVVHEVRLHALKLTPSMLASLDAAQVTDSVDVDPWNDILRSKLGDDGGDEDED